MESEQLVVPNSDAIDGMPSDLNAVPIQTQTQQPQLQTQSQNQEHEKHEEKEVWVPLSDEELKERREILLYLSNAKILHKDVFDSLGFTEAKLAELTLEELKQIQYDYKICRDSRQSFELFVAVGVESTRLIDKLGHVFGLKTEGCYEAFSHSQSYKETLADVVHDYFPGKRVNPLQRLGAIVFTTVLSVHTANSLVEKTKDIVLPTDEQVLPVLPNELDNIANVLAGK